MAIYFTADTHFGHEKVMEYSNRPFANAAEMDEALVKRLIYYNDVYIFKIEDAFLTAEGAYDVDDDRFEDPFLAICRDLREEEKKIRQDLESAADHLLTRNRIFFQSVSREEEIVDTLIDLFGRRKEVS